MPPEQRRSPQADGLPYAVLADLARRSVVASRIAKGARETRLERALLDVAAAATDAALARRRLP